MATPREMRRPPRSSKSHDGVDDGHEDDGEEALT